MLQHPELALARAAAHGVDLVVTVVDPTEDPVCTFDNLNTWLAQADELLAEWSACGAIKKTNLRLPDVRIIIGCHPHNASKYAENIEHVITEAIRHHTQVVGIGEIGLDYHYDNSPRDVQQQVFRRQIQLAHEYNTTIALHLREAHQDGLRILKEEGVPDAGLLLHCFNLDYATLEPFLEIGCMVAYGGPLTFKKADEVRDAASRTPLDRLVTETDAPFMAPHPLRGTVCGPENVIYTAALLAQYAGQPGQVGQTKQVNQTNQIDQTNQVNQTKQAGSFLSAKHALDAFYANANAFFKKRSLA
jgi:TatD DNase family protein